MLTQYISILSEEELLQLCQIIGPKMIKSRFQSKPKEFGRIRPGFRAATIPDDEAISLVVRNKSNPFIADFVQATVNYWLNEISECLHTEEVTTVSPERALISVLSRSVFSSHIPLYFRLIQSEHSSEFISAIQVAVELQQQRNETTEPTQQTVPVETEQLESLREEISTLRASLSNAQLELQTVNASYAQATEQIAGLQHAVADAASRHEVLAARESELLAQLAQYQKMEQYADIAPETTPTEEYPYLSLCQVYPKELGNRWLIRLADISNGEIKPFTRIDGIPHRFTNRDRLYWKDGPDDVDYIGIWQWNAIPNLSDPSNDYVKTRFDRDIQAIEIIECLDCDSYADIIERLASLSLSYTVGHKLLVTTKAFEHRMKGLLLKPDDYVLNDTRLHLKSDVFALPQYEISLSDTITFSNRQFYRYTSLGLPVGVYHVRQPLAIVRDIILTRATSTVLRAQGLSKKEAQHCQGFLKELPLDSLLQEVSDACHCTPDEAQAFIDQFIAQADSYLSDADIDVGTLSAAVARSATLIDRCKQLLTAEWEEENQEKQAQAQACLSDLAAQIAAAQTELDGLEAQKVAIAAEVDHLHQTFSAQEALAADVEKRVLERINEARKNAAAFLADMAFRYPDAAESTMPSASLSRAAPERILLSRQGATIKSNYQISDPDSFFDELADNLIRVGYSKGSVNAYTQVLTFCIDNHMPIVCKHNADAIADCLAAMFGTTGAYTATVPISTGDSRPICESIDQLVSDSDTPIVVLIHGVFDGFSNNAFTQIIQYAVTWREKVHLVISIESVEPASIPCAVWSKAMFIDGDSGIDHIQSKELHAHSTDAIFGTAIDADAVHDKRKTLKVFAEIISNVALLNYAKYLVFNDSTLESDSMLQRQILCYGASAHKSDRIDEILSEMGVNTTEIF